MYGIVFILAWLFHLTDVAGQEISNRAYYAIQHKAWPCEASLDKLRNSRRPLVSFLYNTFGTNNSCVQEFLSWPASRIEMHLSNGSCMRYHRCGRYEITRGYSVGSLERAINNGRFRGKWQRYVAQAAPLVAALPASRCFVSPMLESNLSRRARTRLARWTREILPNCRIVDNPVSGPYIAAAIPEIHYSQAPISSGIYNNDGGVVKEADWHRYILKYRHSDIKIFWKPRYNCRQSLNSPFVDPRRRRNCGL